MGMNIRILGVIIIFFFGLLIFLTSRMEGSRFTYSAEEMFEKAQENYTLNEESLKDLKEPVIIDLNEPQIFANQSLDGAINVPFAVILENEYQTFWRSNEPKVLTAREGTKAFEAWMLLTQMGYENLYVYLP
jgi:uncharacterized protein YacL